MAVRLQTRPVLRLVDLRVVEVPGVVVGDCRLLRGQAVDAQGAVQPVMQGATLVAVETTVLAVRPEDVVDGIGLLAAATPGTNDGAEGGVTLSSNRSGWAYRDGEAGRRPAEAHT